MTEDIRTEHLDKHHLKTILFLDVGIIILAAILFCTFSYHNQRIDI